jgi:hypothetical protein
MYPEVYLFSAAPHPGSVWEINTHTDIAKGWCEITARRKIKIYGSFAAWAVEFGFEQFCFYIHGVLYLDSGSSAVSILEMDIHYPAP